MFEYTFTYVTVDGYSRTYRGNHDLMTWYNMLNGEQKGANAQNFSSSEVRESSRAKLVGELEAIILKKAYAIPVYNSFSASLMSYKVDYISYDYNTFMGYGGVKYMEYKATNGEFAKDAKNLDYKI